MKPHTRGRVEQTCYLPVVFAARRAAAFGSTTALNVAPGVNLGTVPAGIFMAMPVRGFFPVRLSQALRAEAKKYGVQVNVLCPGVVNTPMVTHAKFSGIEGKAATEELKSRTPIAEPDRIAADLIKGVLNNKGVIVTPTTARFAIAALRYLPFAGDIFARKFIERIRTHKIKST